MDRGALILVAISVFLVIGSIANLVAALLAQSGVFASAVGVGATVTGLITVVLASSRR